MTAPALLDELPRKEWSTPRRLYALGDLHFVVAEVPEVGALAFPAHPGGDVFGPLVAGGDGATVEGVLRDLTPCGACGGSGECPKCAGSAVLGERSSERDCPECEYGSCRACGGSGR